MTNLKRSFFWAALYLGLIFVLGQADYAGRPIINFASYFYLAVIVAVPVTLFLPFHFTSFCLCAIAGLGRLYIWFYCRSLTELTPRIR